VPFWQEIKRRKVFQVGVAYAVLAWLIIQIANNFFPPLGLPAWTLTLVAVLILVGFPFALLLAWAYELTPDGVRLTRSVADDAQPAAKPAVASYVITAVLAAGIGAGAFWYLSRDADSDWLEDEAIPKIESYIAAGDMEGALAATREAEARVGNDPALVELWPRFSWRVAIPSDPPGATVWRRAYDAPESAWEELGVTPLENVRIPIGLSRLRFELDGHLPLERAIGGGLVLGQALALAPATPLFNETFYIGTETFKLDTAETLPEGKVRVPGWSQSIAGETLAFADFFLDRTEVTNAAYKAFLDAGGYEQPDFWDRVVSDGAEVPWQEAMRLFTDATGRPGPSTWRAGDYPEGQDLFPVSGVSWYEAAAYARFMRQELPTIHHWRRALAGAMHAWELPVSNLESERLLAVGESGAMSYIGAYDLAGNVREWSATARGDERVVLGGSWNDAHYVALVFNTFASRPLDRSASNGIRLAITRDDPGVTALARAPLSAIQTPAVREPVSDEVFAAYKGMFAYERSPLNAASEARDETRIWTRERITFDAAYGGERVTLYLYLPRNGVPPYQTVIYWPGGDALTSRSFDDHPVHLDYVLKSGRAVAFPVYAGTFERGGGVVDPNASSLSRRDRFIRDIKDMLRSLDYLESRADIDREALAYFGYSWGAAVGPVALAQEPRVRVAVLYVGYVPELTPVYEQHPEIDPVNALPRVHVPVLLLNGEFDTSIPPGGDRRVLELLGTQPADQHHVVAPGGHFVPRDTLIRETLAWLDEYLGAPRAATSVSSLH
jgi:predicted esterase